MKTRETTPGKTYSVHTTSGCTVSDKNGWSKTIDAPDGYFTAHAGEVTIDGDDAADVRELFKLAPQQRLALLGVLGGGVPAWFAPLKAELTALLDGSKFELAWQAGEKKLVVHTDRVDDAMLNAVKATAEASMPATATLVQYNHNMEISWRDINKYAECESVEDLVAVAPDKHEQYTTSPYSTPWRTLDLTSDGDFVYPLPKLKSLKVGYGYSYFQYVSVPKFKISLPSLSSNSKRLFNTVPAKEIECDLPVITNCESLCAYCRSLERVKAYTPKGTNFNYAFPQCSKLTTVEIDLSNATVMDDCFFNTILNKESTLHVLNGIPAYSSGSHPLTIGIHIDHQTDDEVLAAIANAEAKGWTLTVQWNGTPTAQASVTYGLRKPTIYARVSEHDGKRYLDWGHYVTDPSGYEEFRSVEAAREYFGLPAEDLTETE